MKTETRNCQNCHVDFQIEPQDFAFYEKIKVPPPTFCPQCRFQRRLMFRNERVLYKRTCGLCGKGMISTVTPESPYVVYCNPCWWAGDWEASTYGREYDLNRNFFEQLKDLQKTVPFPALTLDYLTNINSEYTNYAGHLKNCYLVFDADNGENVLYSKGLVDLKDSMDVLNVGESELCYEDVRGGGNSRLFYSQDCDNCIDTFFSLDCTGCNNCFGCVNLKNKKYHIFNQPYPKEEYEKKIAEYRLDTRQGIDRARRESDAFFKTLPHKDVHGYQNIESTGEYVYESKNVKDAYGVRRTEDSRYCQLITMGPVKDCYDYTEWGHNASRLYECITTGEGIDNVHFSWATWREGSMNNEYCMFVLSSQNVFGSIGMKKKQYCILNKQYTKEEYEKLRAQIIADLEKDPYIDSKERVFKYGEFFPYDLSLFAYNETTAAQYFPTTKEDILRNGWRWREPAANMYQPTKIVSELPQSIHDVQDDIVNEIIGCPECGKVYRIVKAELDLLRRFQFPLPTKCPDCRHFARLKRLNPPQLWDRVCHCGGERSLNGVYTNTVSHAHGAAHCGAAFKTAYSPDWPEIVYCDSCFKTEFI